MTRGRGTPFDIFGYPAERRHARGLVDAYRQMILTAADKLTDRNMATAVELARSASSIAGYGAVKDAGVETYRKRTPELLAQLDRAPETETPTLAVTPRTLATVP